MIIKRTLTLLCLLTFFCNALYSQGIPLSVIDQAILSEKYMNPNSQQATEESSTKAMNSDKIAELSAKKQESKIESLFNKDQSEEERVKQYGYDIFENLSDYTNSFNIPVDGRYILGPNDEVRIRIWGKLESNISSKINEDGRIFINKVGYVQVSGLSLDEANQTIQKELSKHFVNINSNVSIEKTRSIPVFVLGHVKLPGAYNISSVSTLMHALYISGGPNKEGSLRHIELRRKNSKTQIIDLYDYIMNGNPKQDPQLSANDVIYVPAIGNVVKVNGGIKTPSIFEIREADSLESLIYNYASGLSSDALFKTITIKRNNDGIKQVLSISSSDTLASITLKHGDSIYVQTTDLDTIDGIQINGHVNNPGLYHFKDGASIKDLIIKANDFKENAYLNRIKISRLGTGQVRKTLFINYYETPNAPLQNQDIVSVVDSKAFGVDLSGAVKTPGNYMIDNSSTLKDLVKTADEFNEDAYVESIHIFRLNDNLKRENIFINYNKNPDFKLKPFDKVNVPENQDYFGMQHISIGGEVYRPDLYPYANAVTLKDILQLAGLKESSELRNIELYRKNFTKDEPSSADVFKIIDARNIFEKGQTPIFLLPNDSILVRKKTNTSKKSIYIEGMVTYPGVYYFQEGEKISDLIQRAGGFRNEAFLEGVRYSRPSIKDTLNSQLSIIRSLEKKQQVFESNVALNNFDNNNLNNYQEELQEASEKADKFAIEELKDINTRIVTDFTDKDEYDSIIPRNNDRIFVPRTPEFIHLVGGVVNEGNIKFKRKKSISYYINKSGGFNKYADKKKLVVIKSNGEVDNNPGKIEVGDTIYVPEKLQEEFKLSVFLTQLFDSLFKAATVVSIINNL